MYNRSIGRVAWIAERTLYGNCAQHRKLSYARVLPGALAQDKGLRVRLREQAAVFVCIVCDLVNI